MASADGPRLIGELLNQAGGSLGHTTLMKLLFLLSQETVWGEEECPYEFVPYRFGPFSFAAYRDLAKLEAEGIVERNERRVTLAPGAHAFLGGAAAAVSYVVAEYGGRSHRDLLAGTYRRYPWYSVLTERADLVSEPVSLPTAPRAVYTVGYGGRSIDGFLNHLLARGLQGVIDVRSRPCSRVFGFAKSRLQDYLQRLGLSYVGEPGLGVPPAQRQGADAPAARQALLCAYGWRVAEARTPDLERVATAVRERPVALLCVEADPAACHRSILAGIVAARTGLPIVHL